MFVRTPFLAMLAHSEKNHNIFCRMDSAGLLSVSILLVLALCIFFSYNCGPSKCGFENPPLPPKYTGISDLPAAPQNNLADVNSLPYQDPVTVKTSSDMLRQLKQDMSGFKDFELENMPDISDPSIKLPITQFKGDYQRVTDEVLVVDRTPGVQPSLSVQHLNEMAANLRFLQRTYRTYSDNQMVPEPQTSMCQVGALEPVEGFVSGGTTNTPSLSTFQQALNNYNNYTSWASGTGSGSGSGSSTATALMQTQAQAGSNAGSNLGSNVAPTPTSTPTYSGDPNQARITRTQLDLLVQKLSVEITRLQASGTTDPIIRARVNIFMKIRQSLKDIQTALDKGTMKVADIPILVKDYNNFLPALGNTNTGIAALLSETGFSSLSSLFSSYTNGDITNSKINNHLLHIYARALLSGLSYKFDVSYTSPNEVAARRAEAVKAAYDAGDNGTELGMNLAPTKMITSHPRMMHGSRGSFESHIRHMDMHGTERDSDGYSRPFGLGQRQGQGQGQGEAGGFNWKARAENIFDNVKRAGMEPNDYGIDPEVYANTQQSDFSWRGYTKMVCSRLGTNAEAGTAEKMGCPPASWKGWRS